ncbi:HHIP-like protein 1 [Amblyomma americanum]
MCTVRFLCALFLLTDKMCASEPCYGLERALSGLRHPVSIVPLPQNEQDVLVGEHRGIIMQITLRHAVRSKNAHVFLNITNKILTTNAPADERGLLSFVLDPDFPEEKYVYVCYSAPPRQSDMDHETAVSRFHILGDDGNAIFKVRPVVLLRVAQRDRRYNGGQLLFGPDRFLYVTTGDDASNASHRFDLDSLLGKVLRLDVRGRQRYAIPADNPFVGLGHPVLPEVYAYGFRNPWRCTVYPSQHTNGTLLCGDTGVEPHRPEEEVYLVEAGKRYGWEDVNRAPCCRGGSAAPVFRYTKSGGQAIVGGIVYGGRALPRLRAKFLYADFVHGSLHALEEVAGQSVWVSEDICLKACDGQPNSLESFYVLAIGTDANDEPLILTTTDLRNDAPKGAVYRLTGADCGKRRELSSSQGASHAAGDDGLAPVILAAVMALVKTSTAP